MKRSTNKLPVVTKKWKLTNVDSSLTFGSVEDFFNKTSSAKIDTDIIKQHIANDENYKVVKQAELNVDNKSVIIIREFADEETFKEWDGERSKLPSIDEGVQEQSMKVEPNWAYKFDNGDFKR